MAFVTALAAHGYTYSAAYIKAHIAHCDTAHSSQINSLAYARRADNGAEPDGYDNDLRQYQTDLLANR